MYTSPDSGAAVLIALLPAASLLTLLVHRSRRRHARRGHGQRGGGHASRGIATAALASTAAIAAGLVVLAF